MLNLKATLLSAAVLAGATATISQDQKLLITNCASDVIAYKFEKPLFRDAQIFHLFSAVKNEWTHWCVENGQLETVDGKTATCERILRTDVTLQRKKADGRTAKTIVFDRQITDRYFPPGGHEALRDIGAEDAQFVRYDRKTIDFTQGVITKSTVQFLAPRGSQYTSAKNALDDAYYRTRQINKSSSYHKNDCVLRATASGKLSFKIEFKTHPA